MIKAMMAMGSTKTTQPSTRVTKSTKHSWENHYGKGKYFPDKAAFLDWLHSEPDVTTKSVSKNGAKWYWCSKCERFTSHKTSECTRKAKRSAIKASAHLSTSTSVDTEEIRKSDSEESGFSTETFEDKPRPKKMRRSIRN